MMMRPPVQTRKYGEKTTLMSSHSDSDESAAPTDRRTTDGQNMRYVSVGKPVRILRRFPVSTLLTLPYFVLILPQAVLNDNPALPFIVSTFLLALAASLIVELLPFWNGGESATQRSSEKLRAFGPALRITGLVGTAIGCLSGLLFALAGGGTIAAQTGRISINSSITSLFSPFTTWTVTGPALLIAAYIAGKCSKRTIALALAIALFLEIYKTTLTGITAPMASYLIFITVLLFYAGILKVRYGIAAALLVLIVWPALFDLRNDVRVESGVAVSKNVTAFDRLRYDEFIGRAENIPPGLDLGQPGLLDVVRYGLIPRALDPDRPSISTGILINIYLGGTSTSAYNFLPVATHYVLDGPEGLAIYYAVLAAIVAATLRCGHAVSPLRLVLFCVILIGPLGWFSTYPDSSISAIQSIVAAVPLLLGAHIGRSRLSLQMSGIAKSPARLPRKDGPPSWRF